KDLGDKFSKYTSAVFVDYRGLNVSSIETIRRELRKDGIDFKVVKKTLLHRALDNVKINFDIHAFQGQLAVVFGYGDEIAPAKLIHTFTKNFELLKILGGIFEGMLVGPEKISALATVPAREELLSKMVGSMQAPIGGFVNVLAGNIRGLAQVLKAISQRS
ncbi:MAG: 50S ribosomal protein L10, partial [Candidatus Spechtbacteria bacterium]|nr:50S ribosomal protein L10 [Candidatus Spechtbacteria bacterium]